MMPNDTSHARHGPLRIVASILVAAVVASMGGVTAQQPGGPSERVVTIGVVRDGPGPEMQILDLLKQELPQHLQRNTVVEFNTSSDFDAGWEFGRVRQALQNALDDPDIEYVLAVGSLVTYEASKPDMRLTKPVVSSFVQRADLGKLPYSVGDGSLKENLSFIAIPQRAERDVEAFRELVPFQALHVAVTLEDLNNIWELREGLMRFEQAMGIEVALVAVTPEIEDSLPKFGGNVQAVYLTRLQRLDREQRARLIGELNDREIPTFSLLGHPDVELGALAGHTPDIRQQVVRRVVINLDRLIRGAAVSDLPVLMSVDTRMVINARTAAVVDYYPPSEVRLFADFLHPEVLMEEAESLTFAEALKTAEAGNTALSVKDSEVESVRQDQFRARSGLLPQVFLDLDYLKTDATLVNPIFPDGSANATTGSLTLHQLIYDDSVWSDYHSSERVFEGSEWARETERLDVLASAGQAYLQLALADALRSIRADNLRLTEDFRELARLRRDVGFSGREEILRWESAVAEGRSDLYRADQDVEETRIALNQILSTEQDRRWVMQEFEIDSEVFPIADGRFDDIFDDYTARRNLRDVLVDYALANTPEIQSINKTIEAQDIQVDQLKRRYYVPTFFADLSYSDRLSRSGNSFLIPEEDFYSIFIGASYPIFEGGRKRSDVRKASADLEALERGHRLIEERVEQRTRTALRRCENSFPRIKFNRQAAAAANANLDLVVDQYTEGLVNVTDLLDAQNNKFAADQFATIAVYEFLLDQLELERALAWFKDDRSPEEQDAFVQQIRSAVGSE
jgi:outer membrane protein TolC